MSLDACACDPNGLAHGETEGPRSTLCSAAAGRRGVGSRLRFSPLPVRTDCRSTGRGNRRMRVGAMLRAWSTHPEFGRVSTGLSRHSGEDPDEGLHEVASWRQRSRISPERYRERSSSALTRCSIPRMVEHNGEAGESPALSRNCKLRRPPVRSTPPVADGCTQQARSPAGLRGHLPSPQRR
jgi:hypothetical protein